MHLGVIITSMILKNYENSELKKTVGDMHNFMQIPLVFNEIY